MSYNQDFIDEVMFLFDEERQPFSRIAYMLDLSVDEVDKIVCSQIASNTLEIV